MTNEAGFIARYPADKLLPGNASDSGDDSAGRNFFFAIELEGGELRKFQKGRPGIKESVDTIAGDEFALKSIRSSIFSQIHLVRHRDRVPL